MIPFKVLECTFSAELDPEVIFPSISPKGFFKKVFVKAL